MAKGETSSERAAREYKRRTTFDMATRVAAIIYSRRNPAWRESWLSLEQILCEVDDDLLPKFLRWVADILQERPRSVWEIRDKRPYSPGSNWYDYMIKAAYDEAFARSMPRLRVGQQVKWPSFSEFLDIFREQNPKLQGASARSLRRSLERLGYHTRPDKRGRPTQNRDRKQGLTR
jgi:hypothetical protein